MVKFVFFLTNVRHYNTSLANGVENLFTTHRIRSLDSRLNIVVNFLSILLMIIYELDLVILMPQNSWICTITNFTVPVSQSWVLGWVNLRENDGSFFIM